ncbi:MAG: DNA primase [Planctomycetota bacterium]
MPLISDETILEVQRSVDIYEVVSGYIPLKRSGSNYKGLCPFHDEKTPSFMVHPERQIFKCFGCQKGGNVFGFVMAMENIEFPEAIRMLAERVGISVKYEGGTRGPDRTGLYRTLEWASKRYQRLLAAHPEADRARKYAEKRGLKKETIERWGIGYSRDSWDDLVSAARKNEVPQKALLAAGLVNERQSGGVYDRFRGRLMFPIRDVRGRVVGFGGRALGDAEPKYLNSPETALFNKSRLLYGLDVAREDARDSRALSLVEGYLDVVLPAQEGVQGLVATLGTALTRDHLSLLRRYADRVVLVFDADAAGKRAAERGLDLLLGENLDLFVARMPAGKDPADVVTQEGPDRLRAIIGEPVEIFRFLVESVEERVGGDTPAARTRVIGEMAERIAQVPDEIKREVLVQQLAARYRLPDGTIRSRIRAMTGDRPEEAPPMDPRTLEADERVGRELIGLMLQDPAVLGRLVERVPPDRFPSRATRKIAAKVVELFENEGSVRAADVVSLMQDEESMGLVADILACEPVPDGEVEQRVAGCVEYLESREYRLRARELRAGLRDGERADECLRRLQKERGLRNPRAVPRG